MNPIEIIEAAQKAAEYTREIWIVVLIAGQLELLRGPDPQGHLLIERCHP